MRNRRTRTAAVAMVKGVVRGRERGSGSSGDLVRIRFSPLDEPHDDAVTLREIRWSPTDSPKSVGSTVYALTRKKR